MAKGEVWEKWMEENVVKVTLYVNMKKDAELYQALTEVEQAGGSKSAAIKKWVQMGLATEKRKRKK